MRQSRIPMEHDAPGLFDEFIPCVAAMVDDVVLEFEHAVGEPVVSHELPDVFGGVEFRAFGRSGMMVMLAGRSSLSVIC